MASPRQGSSNDHTRGTRRVVRHSHSAEDDTTVGLLTHSEDVNDSGDPVLDIADDAIPKEKTSVTFSTAEETKTTGMDSDDVDRSQETEIDDDDASIAGKDAHLRADSAGLTHARSVDRSVSGVGSLQSIVNGGSLPMRTTQKRSRYANTGDPAASRSHGLLQPMNSSSTVGGTWHKTHTNNNQSWLDPLEAKIDTSSYTRGSDLNTLNVRFASKTRRANMQEVRDLFDEDGSNDGFSEENEDEFDEDVDDFERRQSTKYGRDDTDIDDDDVDDDPDAISVTKEAEVKTLGWLDGVLCRCLLNIFGVIMFVRIGWAVGQAGIPLTILTMLICSSISFTTILSMCALCTNGEVRGGGAYYLTSRSLGPAVGGAVGLLFSFGNMVAVSMYFVGFAETLVASLSSDPAKGLMFSNPINDIRIFSNLLLFMEFGVLLVGLKYVSKIQIYFLILLCVIIFTFFIGSFYQVLTVKTKTFEEWTPDRCTEPDDFDGNKQKVLFGVQGWSSNIGSNMSPRYVTIDGVNYDFFGVLGVLFPAFTGIMAGANVSGDLMDPGKAIPKGTLLAWAISVSVYILIAIFMGAVASNCFLINDYLSMAVASIHPWILQSGILLSTAMAGLTSMSSAPRLLQAVASDHLIPIFNRFEKLNSSGDPINGYILCLIVVFLLNCIGSLNLIAPLITEFFIMTYGMVNAACFGVSIAKSPGWRPSFRYFSKWTAFAGALECLICMFLIHWGFALATLVIGFAIYQYIQFTEPTVNWGSVADSRAYFDVYTSLLRLRRTREHIKNWRPAFLVFVRDPMRTAHTVLFAQTLTKAYGPIFYGTIRTGDCSKIDLRKFRAIYNGGYLPESSIPKSIKGFYECAIAPSLKAGAQMLLQMTGTGRLRPNTLVLGFKHNWQKYRSIKRSQRVIADYVSIIRDSLTMGFGVMVHTNLRHINFLQPNFIPPTSAIISGYNNNHSRGDSFDDTLNHINKSVWSSSVKPESKYLNLKSESVGKSGDNSSDDVNRSARLGGVMNMAQSLEGIAATQNIWAHEQALWAEGQGTNPIIDVWWLLDDGGLLMLIPHIMKQHRFWRHCRLRANVIGDDESVDSEIVAVRKLIRDFRLDFEDPRHIPLGAADPSLKTVKEFENLNGKLLPTMKNAQTVARWLRVSELMFEHSRYSGLVIVSLPQPRNLDPIAYMALLQCLCKPGRMPPMIMMRGNGESALTFYLQ